MFGKTSKRRTKKNITGGKDQYFHFRRADDPEFRYDGKLRSVQCKGHTIKGVRCKRHSVIGTPYCREHLRKIRKISIRKSTIPNSGNGLFADEPGKLQSRGDIVFRKKDIITKYDGQRMTEEEVDDRYGDDDAVTGPYVVRVPIHGIRTRKRGNKRVQERYRIGWSYLDGATKRGVGNLANMAMRKSDNNAELKKENAALEATKDIRQGDEIFVDYGDDYRFDGPERYSTNFSKYKI
jgi:hypothetical protein